MRTVLTIRFQFQFPVSSVESILHEFDRNAKMLLVHNNLQLETKQLVHSVLLLVNTINPFFQMTATIQTCVAGGRWVQLPPWGTARWWFSEVSAKFLTDDPWVTRYQMMCSCDLFVDLFVQDTTSGSWTDTGSQVRPEASHKCGGSHPPLTLCSHAAAVTAKPTCSRSTFLP